MLYRNNGKGVFTDVSAAAGIAPHVGNGLGVAVGDYDDDGLPDVFVANDAVPNFLFHNEGGGRFTEVGLAAGVAVARDGKPRAGMGTEFADYNGDGRLDLVVTNHEFETHSLFRNDGAGVFTDATVESGLGPATLPFVGFGVAFFDFDNNGAQDLAIVNGHVIDNTALFRPGSTHAQRKLLFRNLNGRRVQEIGRAGRLRVRGRRRRAHARHGRRGQRRRRRPAGDQQRRGARAAAERERAAARTSWRLVGTAGNRDALGARVTVTAGGTHAGARGEVGQQLPGAGRFAGARGPRRRAPPSIVWRSGGRAAAPNGVATPAVNQILTVQEGRGVTASTPFARRSAAVADPYALNLDVNGRRV